MKRRGNWNLFAGTCSTYLQPLIIFFGYRLQRRAKKRGAKAAAAAAAATEAHKLSQSVINRGGEINMKRRESTHAHTHCSITLNYLGL